MAAQTAAEYVASIGTVVFDLRYPQDRARLIAAQEFAALSSPEGRT